MSQQTSSLLETHLAEMLSPPIMQTNTHKHTQHMAQGLLFLFFKNMISERDNSTFPEIEGGTGYNIKYELCHTIMRILGA